MNKAVFRQGDVVLFQVGYKLYRVQNGKRDPLRKDRIRIDDALARLNRCLLEAEAGEASVVPRTVIRPPARRRPAVPGELLREARALGYAVTWNAALRKWDVREG